MTGTLGVATDGTTAQALGDGTDYGGSGSHRKGHRYVTNGCFPFFLIKTFG